jgi:hypothetical protein
MTEYELNDLLIGNNSNLANLVAIYFSIFVAFLVCVYIVGPKLSKSQSTAITIVYSMFSIFIFYLIIQTLFVNMRLVDDFYNIDNSTIPIGFFVGPGTLILSWLLSVIYMIQVRYKK